jgi:hypothetical protein
MSAPGDRDPVPRPPARRRSIASAPVVRGVKPDGVAEVRVGSRDGATRTGAGTLTEGLVQVLDARIVPDPIGQWQDPEPMSTKGVEATPRTSAEEAARGAVGRRAQARSGG